ncbi:ParE toxin of type II toxin-antitoxin system, parDE [uncultured archaeon]|nr:ParE toxin of type II toxin-antitoxin system, parDE [uncultured archaeon]
MTYKAFFTPTFEKQLKQAKKKDKTLSDRLKKSIKKVCENHEAGKPLKHDLKGTRRIHLNPFVLVYSIEGETVAFHYYEHHDKAY